MDREPSTTDILSPRSVAVVGVSSEPTKIGSRIYRNIIAGGFVGPVYPVNSAGIVIGGKPVYRSLDAIPAPVDLVIVAVPAPVVESVVAEAARRDVRTIVVISSGFGEVGDVGRALQHRLVALVRESGARLVGPNCFGIINADPTVQLHATFGRVTGGGGSVAFASQSGAMGILFLDKAPTYGLGVRAFVSLGNSADIAVHELIEWWGDDPAIAVITLYLEGMSAGADLVRVGRRVSSRKPIFALTAGRTSVGRNAASSHTAAIAASTEGLDAVLESAGIVRVESIDELLQATYLATRCGAPRGRRIGVITNSGGPGIVFTDRAVSRDLHVPPLSKRAQSELRSLVPKEASLLNPIDLTAAASPAQFECAVRALAGEVDIVVIIIVDIGLTPLTDFVDAVARLAREDQSGVRFTLVVPSGINRVRGESGAEECLSVLDTIEGGADALSALVRTCRATEPSAAPAPLEARNVAALKALVSSWVSVTSERWLRWHEIEALLMLAGIPSVRGWEGALDSITAGVETIGFPLVAKLVIPGATHKSDGGGVVTDIRDLRALERTIGRFRRTAAHSWERAGVILQPYIEGGREGFVGLNVDPQLGPLIGCGWGGIFVEILHDTVLRVPPISMEDADRMVDRLRFRKLLEPFRGAPPHDRRIFEDIIVRLSALAAVIPEIVECDLNPVRVFPEGEGCLVLDARVRIRAR